jgi:hypothetical protein
MSTGTEQRNAARATPSQSPSSVAAKSELTVPKHGGQVSKLTNQVGRAVTLFSSRKLLDH